MPAPAARRFTIENPSPAAKSLAAFISTNGKSLGTGPFPELPDKGYPFTAEQVMAMWVTFHHWQQSPERHAERDRERAESKAAAAAEKADRATKRTKKTSNKIEIDGVEYSRGDVNKYLNAEKRHNKQVEKWLDAEKRHNDREQGKADKAAKAARAAADKEQRAAERKAAVDAKKAAPKPRPAAKKAPAKKAEPSKRRTRSKATAETDNVVQLQTAPNLRESRRTSRRARKTAPSNAEAKF